MIHLTIDGEAVCVPEGTTILEAARKLNVHIPTLCRHEDQAVKAVCRICVVEVEGQRLLELLAIYFEQDATHEVFSFVDGAQWLTAETEV